MPGLTSTRRAIGAAIAFAIMIAPRSATAQQKFQQTNLVSDIPALALHVDPQLSNPWGIALSGASPFWTADNNPGVSTLYNGAGTKQGLVVTVPGGLPTGVVFNNTGSFELSDGSNATFMFATLNGTIDGWNGGAGTSAVLAINDPGAVFTGLALSGTGLGARLYAADFAGGAIDVFDPSFAEMPTSFFDSSLPSGYSPFNIQNIGGSLFVAYAQQDPITHEETKGAGLGIVDEFDLSGSLLRRFASNGSLDAPWGFALAPDGFGIFSNALMIGNFGDGTIHGYDLTTGDDIGVMEDENGAPIVNDGLWGITFGNGAAGGDADRLYFNAGIDDEQHGLFGSLTATTATTDTPEPATLGLVATGLSVLFVRVRRRRTRV